LLASIAGDDSLLAVLYMSSILNIFYFSIGL
jgi:hypothetical protein